MLSIKRKAVLIGCPGQNRNYLKGVRHDINNLIQFLLSERGGSFRKEEIEILFNPTLDELTAAIHGISADYLFVYFSGHGFTDANNRRMISLTNYALADTYLLGNCPRQLVIIDSCRNFIGATIGALPGQADEWFSFTGSPVREIYDQWIAESPFGKIIFHATASGTFSHDSSNGGVFTKALIETSNSYIPTDDYEYAPVLIPQLMTDVRSLLHYKKSSQRPCIVYEDGNMQVPFAVAIHQNQKQPAPVEIQQMPAATAPGLPWAGLALFTLFVVAVSAASK